MVRSSRTRVVENAERILGSSVRKDASSELARSMSGSFASALEHLHQGPGGCPISALSAT